MTTELDQLWADEPANIPPTRDSRLAAAVDHLEQRVGVPHADRDGSEQRVLPPVYRGKAEHVGRSRERELHTYLAADAAPERVTMADAPDPDRVARYAEAIDPEAFDLHKKRSRHPAAVIQWTARCHIARESALASITVADQEQAELHSEVESLRRANRALRDHAKDLSKIAAKCDLYALSAEVAERRAKAAETERARLAAVVVVLNDEEALEGRLMAMNDAGASPDLPFVDAHGTASIAHGMAPSGDDWAVGFESPRDPDSGTPHCCVCLEHAPVDCDAGATWEPTFPITALVAILGAPKDATEPSRGDT